MIVTHNVDVDFVIDEFDILEWFEQEDPNSITPHEMEMIYDSCCWFYEHSNKTTPAERIQRDLDELSEEEQRQIFRNLRRKYPLNYDEL